MKKNTHPKYQKVLFVDSASGYKFVCGSALQTEARETFQGEEYPVVYLAISSSSHPLFTGKKGLVDSEGRVEKFRKRFEKKLQPTPSHEQSVNSFNAPLSEQSAVEKQAKTTKEAKKTAKKR